MASKTIRVCDFDEHGADDDVRAVEHRTFQAEGATYGVDVCGDCDKQFEAFQELTQRWVAAGRAIEQKRDRSSRSRGDRAPTPGSPAPRTDRGENAAIREWAKTQGIAMSDRGRISDELRQRYRQWAAQHASERWDEAAGTDRPAPPRPTPPPGQQVPPPPAVAAQPAVASRPGHPPIGPPPGLRGGTPPSPPAGVPRG